MGDLERTFGAGADFDAIVSYYGSIEDDGNGPEAYPETLKSGKQLPRAETFFDPAGQIWHPSEALRLRLRAGV